jgi:hypothetical protein
MVILAQPFMFLLFLSSKLQITNIIGEKKKRKKKKKEGKKTYFDKQQ